MDVKTEYNEEENDFDINIITPEEGVDSTRVYYSKSPNGPYVLTSLNHKPKGGYYKFVFSKKGYKEKTVYCEVPKKQFFLFSKWILIPLICTIVGIVSFIGYRYYKAKEKKPIKSEEKESGPVDFNI